MNVPDPETVPSELVPRLFAPSAPPGGVCGLCGGPLVRNPHPDAGKPEVLSEIGYVWVCPPCINKAMSGWAKRYHEAERKAARYREALMSVHRLMAEPQGTGADLIAAERQRQISAEGWTPEHDDEHDRGELVKAARVYAEAALIIEHAATGERAVRRMIERHGDDPDTDTDFLRMVENPARHYFGWWDKPDGWPWDRGWWKPSPDPIRNLIKAGALIAAEIDRLQRAATA